MSERDGIFNIWKIAATGGNPVQVTSHSADGVQYPSISPDGRTIIYENEFELWKVSVPDGRPQKITVSLDFDPKYNLVEYLATENAADGFTPSPDGDFLAVDFHGEIFIVPTDGDVGEKTQVTASGWRDRYESWSPDGKWIAHVSDEGGDDEQVWLYEVATGERRQVSDYESLKTGLLWSRDSSRLAFIGSNRLFLTDVERGRSREIAYNEAGGFRLQSFSPDDAWLLYTRGDEHQNTDLYLYNLEEEREFDVTPNPWRESGGALTPDGKTLVFTSNRSGGTTHLFAVPLARLAEDPDDPLARARKQEEEEEGEGERSERGGRTDREAREEESEESEPLKIELEGIDSRARQLTSGENGASSFFLSADGETIYFISSDDDGRGLFSIGIDGEGQRKVTDGSFSGLTPSADRKSVYYRQGANIYHMPLNNRQKSRIDFSFTVTVDKPAEWRQIFFEAWRIMKYRFYDENMHGVDWAAMRDKYEPLLPWVGMNQDVNDLANEMIGELNASHTGVSGGPREYEAPDTYRTTYLGFEMEPDGNALEVSHIYREGPADKEWINLDVGDYVLAINGQEVDASVNYWQILNHTLNDYVTVRVASTPRGNDARNIRIRTVGSLRNIQYQEWVKSRRKMVEEWSDGQIAYVHIRSMNQSSLTVFQNEINHYWDAKGIIVDIRYNGGGNTDQQILDILERRPYEFWNNRWGARSWGRRPRQAIAGPKVMLINARSGSDSEVTPLGFRDLELGRIVGTPTYGAVIATGSYRLIHGGSIRTPGSLVVTWDPTRPNNYGINLENYGVPPDVWAENGPDDELNGFDRELKAAVDEALRMLRSGTWQYDPPGE